MEDEVVFIAETPVQRLRQSEKTASSPGIAKAHQTLLGIMEYVPPPPDDLEALPEECEESEQSEVPAPHRNHVPTKSGTTDDADVATPVPSVSRSESEGNQAMNEKPKLVSENESQSFDIHIASNLSRKTASLPTQPGQNLQPSASMKKRHNEELNLGPDQSSKRQARLSSPRNSHKSGYPANTEEMPRPEPKDGIVPAPSVSNGRTTSHNQAMGPAPPPLVSPIALPQSSAATHTPAHGAALIAKVRAPAYVSPHAPSTDDNRVNHAGRTLISIPTNSLAMENNMTYDARKDKWFKVNNGVPRPLGEHPHDHLQKAMVWDCVAAVWRSVDNPWFLHSPSTAFAPAPQPVDPNPSTSVNNAPSNGTSQDGDPAAARSASESPSTAVQDMRDAHGIPRNIIHVPVLKKRPSGRPPNDSRGFSMEWDPNTGMWFSKINPDETKKPSERVPAGPQASKTPKVKPVRANRSHTDTQRTKGSGIKRPKGRAPHDSSHRPMQWNPIAGVWESLSNPDESLKPGDKVAGPVVSERLPKLPERVYNTPRVNRESVGVVDDAGVDQNKTIAMEATEVGKPGDNPGFPLARPRGRAPRDSIGETMEWDGNGGLWRSATMSDETLKKGEKAPSPPPASSPPPSRPKTQQDARKRPGGRPPLDSNRNSTVWDYEIGAWRSKSNSDEIIWPGEKSVRRHSQPVEGGEPASVENNFDASTWMLNAAEKQSNEQPVEVRSEGSHRRPRGRTRHDSLGQPMEWDSKIGLWRSRVDPEETYEARGKVRMAVQQANDFASDSLEVATSGLNRIAHVLGGENGNLFDSNGIAPVQNAANVEPVRVVCEQEVPEVLKTDEKSDVVKAAVKREAQLVKQNELENPLVTIHGLAVSEPHREYEVGKNEAHVETQQSIQPYHPLKSHDDLQRNGLRDMSFRQNEEVSSLRPSSSSSAAVKNEHNPVSQRPRPESGAPARDKQSYTAHRQADGREEIREHVLRL